MKRPEVSPSGYTKTQAIVTVLFLLAGTLLLVSKTSAAGYAASGRLQNATLVGRETINAPETSLVMLTDEARQAAEAKRAEALSQKAPVATVYMTASAYNSLPGQTDGSPYLTAIGSLTRDGVIASNYFPIGTKIRIPDYYGDKVFRVEDRMNPRYSKTLDIWMESKAQAKEWGRRYVKVEVVQYGKGRGVE